MKSLWLLILLLVTASGFVAAETVVHAQDAPSLSQQEKEVLVMQKQAEAEQASRDPVQRLRWWLAAALPWLAGAGLLFAIWQWVLTRCPHCRRRFPKSLSRTVLRSPTSSRSGLVRISYRCRGCGHEWKIEHSLSRFRIPGGKSGPSSGSGGSSRSGGFSGFGGGSSGGGGATRGY